MENLLRRYISKFFTQKIGLDWWQKAVPDKVLEKTKMRTGNETVFSNIVQTDLTLIDFDDLGEIIYKHKLGFNRPQNLAENLVNINTIEELNKLKADLDSNYNRFFKSNFQAKDFDQKWKELFKIRNKVAHNNLFVQNDLDKTEELHKELKNTILNAESKIDDFKFSIEEQVAIRETITEKNEPIQENENGPKIIGSIDLTEYERENRESVFNIISEEEFMGELARAESTLKQNNLKYVGLKAFITKILGYKGFAIGPSYALANILRDKGQVEIYDVEDPISFWPVKAIRTGK